MNSPLQMRFCLKLSCPCNSCLEKVNKLRQSIQGVASIAIDENQQIATFSGTADPDTVMKKLAAKGIKKTELLWKQIQPVPPKKQVQESFPKKHQAAKGNAPITVTLDPNTLKKEKEKENKKADLQQKPVKTIHVQPSKEAPQPAKGNTPITVTLDPNTLKKEHKKEKEKEKENNKAGLQQKPVKKIHDRPREEAPQPGLDESTRKRTPNCCPKSGHKLELKPQNRWYKCNGCVEKGFGPRYRCEPCDYNFHQECISPKKTTTHELFKGSTFEFLFKLDKNLRICDACGRKIDGCFYHCEANNLDMHPCCSYLKGNLCIGDTDFILTDKVNYDKVKCLWCKKRRPAWIGETGVPGWSYVSEQNGFYCHVYCIRKMVLEAWKKGGFYGTNDDDGNSTMELSKVDLKVMANSNGNGGGRPSKILKSVCTFLRVIIGILFGDPIGVGIALVPMVVELMGN